MAEAVFSPSWYRIAPLRPMLRGHVQVRRHHYRGHLWYLLQDHSSQRSLRFNLAAYYVVGLMNGRRTIEEIWGLTSERLQDDAPTQEELLRLFSELHSNDMLISDLPPDLIELQDRHERKKRSEWLRRFMNPMSVRFPLFDPDNFLQRTMPWVRPFLGPLGVLVWLRGGSSARVRAVLNWPELSRDVTDRVVMPENLLIMGVLFPVLKALHELGHGYAIKRWGGEVHDMGVMLLVLMPIPYVDAAAATGFRSRRQRVIVGAAGMLVETFLASAAMLLWSLIEPSALRAVLYDIMLISGVSTLIFNANPLLRFDGYYILADWLEIPNLAQRSTKYVAWLCQKYLLILHDVTPPIIEQGEHVWMLFFAVASFIYRMFVAVAICLFVASKFFIIGIMLGIWAAVMMFVLPVIKIVNFLFTSPLMRRHRFRGLTISASLLAAFLALLFVVPMPFMNVIDGIITLPDDAYVRMNTEGFVNQLVPPPGAQVKKGDLLFRCTDPVLDSRYAVLKAQLEELEVRERAGRVHSLPDAQQIAQQSAVTEAELARVAGKLEQLQVRSPASGRFVVPRADDLPGRMLKQGELLAYIVDGSAMTVRTVVPQVDVELVLSRLHAVSIRLAGQLWHRYPVRVIRAVPSASDELPSIALTRQGGGSIENDPFAKQANIAFQKYFEFELVPESALLPDSAGRRVYVRFDYGWSPMAAQWYRGLKKLFMGLFMQ